MTSQNSHLSLLSRMVLVLGLALPALFACAPGEEETPEQAVTIRDRLPLDSLPDARPGLEADSVQAYAALLEELRLEADSEGEFVLADSSLYTPFGAGATDGADPGNPVGREAPIGSVRAGIVAEYDVDFEREPPPRTVFGTDDRGIPRDIYPYKAVGILAVDDGHCTATLVGPRHILTASHCFGETGRYGQAVFAPYFYSGNVPYGAASVIHVIGRPPSGIPADDDFAIGILDRRLGDSVGWLGWNPVDDRWFPSDLNDWPSFVAVGYSGDWYDGMRPGADWGTWLWWRYRENQYVVAHDGDVIQGASGGPIFAQFPNGSWRIVGIIVAGPRDQWAPDSAFRPGYANWLVDTARFAGVISQARDLFP